MAIQAQLYQENLGFPLFGSQDWMTMDASGCGLGYNQLCFNAQQKNHQHQQQILMPELQIHHHHHQQRNDNIWLDNTSFPSSTTKNDTTITTDPRSSMAFSHSAVDQVEKQRQEIDQYVKLQNERLRLMLQEQRKQQFLTLVKKIEPKLLGLLRYKDEEIAQATKRAMELEDMLRKLEAENQIWQRVAQENEAMVVSLNNSLEQARERALCCVTNGAEDAESCCDAGMEEEGENRGEGQNDNVGEKTTMVCKGCNSRSSSVLFLPCRHLCSCKACEAFLDSCPVCRTTKKASIEALI